ncbi:MAG: porin [Hoeflea sp.]|uniref:porin n=1 Tax=Hoeflea sp. TaxID=1940281 RepID=UPI001D2EFAD5|nr:porin [Hoeflea sp.]MBU4528351.1 porin [Alphaproteobacteria bacterium]MBU4543020.1 porin [Alphaproteobacteria bacterium]MBU4551711.1 porin [Alphaproteobacteria bacterium]MBV1723606.1 porin [Hoeflea sp.]MBV1761922.1 porin [Hoeflea sp.]
MNIKSLLIGSAAALVAVSGARAADAIIAAEPEPVEYVRVCDAFGVGYFYIPGTETCLRISGYVRVDNNFADHDVTGAFNATATGLARAGGPYAAIVRGPSSSRMWQTTRARVNFSAKSDTEYGTLEGYIGMQGNDGAMGVDEVFLELGGLRMGMFYHWLDSGLAGETDSIAGLNTRFNSIRYQMSGGAFTYGVSLDQLGASWATNSAVAVAGTEGVGVSGNLGGTFGAVTASLTGFYDTEVNEGGVRFLASAQVGPGTLGVMALYNTGPNAYVSATGFGVSATAFMYTEWYAGADYTFQATDKLKLGVAGQYTAFKTNEIVSRDAGDAWKVGATADYAITTGLALKADVHYESYDASAYVGTVERDSWTGKIRLQRSF